MKTREQQSRNLQPIHDSDRQGYSSRLR